MFCSQRLQLHFSYLVLHKKSCLLLLLLLLSLLLFYDVQMNFLLTHRLCATTAQADSGVVDAVMKMWPPPAGPKEREPGKGAFHGGSSQPSPSINNSCEAAQPPRSNRPPDQPGPQSGHPEQPNAAAKAPVTPRPPGNGQEPAVVCSE